MEAVATPAVKPKLKLSDLTYDQLAQTRIKISDQIKIAEDAVKALKDRREKIDVEFLARFSKEGVTNVKTKHGTPYIVTRTSAGLADRDVFMNWIYEGEVVAPDGTVTNPREVFMDVRPSKDPVVSWKEEHDELPPGVSWSAKNTLGFKK